MHTSLSGRLTEALDDERKAIATYRRVIEKFGPVRPFVNIVEAEERHAAAIVALFQDYGLAVPAADPWPAHISVPDTLQEACREAVAGEKENIMMYDRLLAGTPEPDVRLVLQNLQAASRDRHLPAFERCVSRGAGGHGAGGCGRTRRRRSGGGLWANSLLHQEMPCALMRPLQPAASADWELALGWSSRDCLVRLACAYPQTEREKSR